MGTTAQTFPQPQSKCCFQSTPCGPENIWGGTHSLSHSPLSQPAFDFPPLNVTAPIPFAPCKRGRFGHERSPSLEAVEWDGALPSATPGRGTAVGHPGTGRVSGGRAVCAQALDHRARQAKNAVCRLRRARSPSHGGGGGELVPWGPVLLVEGALPYPFPLLYFR